MDRRIGRKAIKDENHKSRYKRVFTSWVFWIIFFGIIMMVFYGVVENSLLGRQPSPEWSLGVGVLDDIPGDFRKIDYIKSKDNDGIALAYLMESGVQLRELDILGEVKRTLHIPMDTSDLKLITVELVEENYNIYISDRKVLDRLDIDIDSWSQVDKERVSNHSEQFDTIGSSIIVGDDDRTDIIIDGEIVATYEDYEDLKKVRIKEHKGKVYASMDTIHGGDIIVVSDEGVNKKNITSVVQQETYGYIADLYIKDDMVTVLSHYFNPTEPMPTLIGAWKLDANNLEERDFWLWNHPRTTLEPRIIEVDGNIISYILGIQQRLDENKDRVLSFPIEQSGMFTNLSIYNRQESSLIDYTRLTNTREYPLGYGYIELDQGDVLIWLDKSSEGFNLMMAGQGEAWTGHSLKNIETNYVELVKAAVMMFVTTAIWGILFFIIDIFEHWKIISLFALAILGYDRLIKQENEKKDKGILLAIITFVIGLKYYITVISNGQLKQYIDIYPNLFGNNTLLGSISIVTSILSIFIYSLWYRKNVATSRLIKSGVFIGIETYFYCFSILVYLQSAMLKIKYMV